MIGRLKEILRTAGGEWVCSFTTRADPRQIFDDFHDKDVQIEIKKASKHRSKSANDFAWAMCTDIGNAMRLSKEEVYREAISAVGTYDTLHMRAEAIDAFREIWAKRGIGWFTEVIDYSPIPGCKVVFAYHGSSSYSTDEMSRLLDYLKQDMDSLSLPLKVSKEEEERMMRAWGRQVNRSSSKETQDASSAER